MRFEVVCGSWAAVITRRRGVSRLAHAPCRFSTAASRADAGRRLKHVVRTPEPHEVPPAMIKRHAGAIHAQRVLLLFIHLINGAQGYESWPGTSPRPAESVGTTAKRSHHTPDQFPCGGRPVGSRDHSRAQPTKPGAPAPHVKTMCDIGPWASCPMYLVMASLSTSQSSKGEIDRSIDRSLRGSGRCPPRPTSEEQLLAGAIAHSRRRPIGEAAAAS